jgi:hypothetical protein
MLNFTHPDLLDGILPFHYAFLSYEESEVRKDRFSSRGQVVGGDRRLEAHGGAR